MKDRDEFVYRHVEPTNAGLDVLDTPALVRARSAYRRLLRQIRRDPVAAGSNAELNVSRYLAEIEDELALRAAVAA